MNSPLAREPQKTVKMQILRTMMPSPAHWQQSFLPSIPWIRHRHQLSDVLTDLSGNVAHSVLVLRRAVWCKNMYHLPNTEINSGSRGGCPGHGLAGEGIAAPGTAPWWAAMAAARGRAARGAAVRGRAFATQHGNKQRIRRTVPGTRPCGGRHGRSEDGAVPDGCG